ncbi:MAG: F0F1 ATP synthase subunit gamma [Hoeflea alexandrii]
MQMVAAAKLRRAQEAAEAARPYSQRMAAVMSNIAEAVGSGDDAPQLMTGTGKDDTHLLVVCTAERGMCGGFNSQIARFARDHVRRLVADGKTVKILCVGKKGYDILRREYASMIIERVDFRDVKQMSFAQAETVAEKVMGLFDQGGFDVCTLFYSEFKSAITQVVDRAAAHPRKLRPETEDENTGELQGALRVRAGAQEAILAALCRATLRSRCRSTGAAGECRQASTARENDRDGQRNPQRRRHDRQADADLQPSRVRR